MENVNVQDKIFEYIDAIATKLGVAGEYVMQALVRQQLIGGITTLSIIAAFAVLEAILLVAAFKSLSAYFAASCDYDKKMAEGSLTRGYLAVAEGDVYRAGIRLAIFAIPAVIIFVILAANCAGTIPYAIGKILNPEYYAIREIIDAVS